MVLTRGRSASATRPEDARQRRGDDATAFQPAPTQPASPTAASPARRDDGATDHQAQETFTSDSVLTMVATIQQAQTTAFERLLDRILDHETRRESMTPAAASTPAAPAAHHNGNFANCTARFSGAAGESLDSFLDAVEAYKECTQVGEYNALRGLTMLLTENAAVWWQGIKSTITSWGEAIASLRGAFGDIRPPHKIYQDLFSMHQGHEKTELFVARARALFARLPPGDLTEKVQLDMLYGLLNYRVRERLRRDEITSYDILLYRARHIEDTFEQASSGARTSAVYTRNPPASSGTGGVRPVCPVSRYIVRPSASATFARGPATRVAPTTFAANAAPPAVLPTSTPPSSNVNTERKTRPQCNYCRRFGHEKAQCRKLQGSTGEQTFINSNNIINNQPKVSDTQSESGMFYSLDSIDSDIIFCNDDYYFQNNNDLNYASNNSAAHSKLSNQKFSKFFYDIDNNIISNHNLNVSKNVDTYNEKGCKPKISNNCHDYNNFNIVKKVDTLSENGCNPKFSNNFNDVYLSSIDNNSIVFDNNLTVLDGSDTSCVKGYNPRISENDILFNCVNDNFVCYTGDVDDPTGSSGRDARPIFNISILGFKGTALIDTAAKHCIAGHTLYALLRRQNYPLHSCSKKVKLADGVVRAMDILTTTLQVQLETITITVPFFIFPDSTNNETLLGIDFITTAGVVIDFNKKVWHFSEDNTVKYKLFFEPTVHRSIPCASTVILRDDEGTHLTTAERQDLSDVLSKHAGIFEAGGGPTSFSEHCIDTGNHPPIAVPPYRLTPAKKELMKQEIKKMLDDDVIEECESAWCSPALMVPKSDGSIRFCVDYRRLNAITKTDNYPMPRIDDLLQSTKRNCYISTLDLRSSYWQVPVRKSDKDKTAFISPLGTYRFKKMPFGLKNAPATFQRLIDKFRSCAALKDVTILAYIDDICVISEGFKQHLEDLELVLTRLEEFNLHVNRGKCAFARESVRYLGHIITQDGISTDSQKVSAILDMKEPSTLKHLRTFLQTCSWYRKFIPNFSKASEPLTRLTRKNQIWSWGMEQSQAFCELKRLLTSAPILIQPDFNSPFVLRTDASNYALGAVLMQGDGNQERPIEYASRLLNAAERNYSTTEREALAVVWGVERFRSYLDGHPVIVSSDHQPLRWLLSLKSPTGRLVRWALKLQAFDIRFEYTPGKANVVADTLSRPVCLENTREDCGICSVICDLPSKSPSQLREEQTSDPEVEKIIKELEGADDVAAQRWVERGFLMDQGVLYRLNPDSDSESPQLVIPTDQVKNILEELHNSATAGHTGIDRTYQKVANLFYFTGMRRIISDYVRACIHCQRYKASNAKPPGLLQTPVLNQRNEVLAIDLFGPLPEGDQGERWVFLIEDTATRWVELFALREATAEACAQVLVEEYFLRFGLPRRIISDNGVQFVSAVMQQCMSVLGVKQNFVPLYHPQSNPAERKNRDLKAMLAYLVQEDHTSWPKKLALIRFALNSSRCRTTGKSPAYLTFAREMRSPTEVTHDLRAILDKDNFIPQITPYLRNFINSLSAIRERVELQQDKTKDYADQFRRPADTFQVGDLVLLKSHVISSAAKNVTAKFAPKRDGPYRIEKRVSPTTYMLSHIDQPGEIIGKYHNQDLSVYRSQDGHSPPGPIIPKRRRGRPANRVLVQERGRSPGLEGEHMVTRPSARQHRATRGLAPARYRE